MWEAAEFAAKYNLDNLIAMADVNALGQSAPTMYQHNMEVYRRKFESEGWTAEVIDGHDVEAVLAAFDHAKASKGKPYVILARTVKGHGVSFVAGKEGWHGKALSKEQLVDALVEVGPVPQSPKAVTKEELTRAVADLNSILGPSPDGNKSHERKTFALPPAFPAAADPDYKAGQTVATREPTATR